MTWEEHLRQRLIDLKGERSMQELADETGITSPTLYKILAGDRGIGGSTLETLRQRCPGLIADVFLPEDSPIGEQQSTTGDNGAGT